MKMTLTDESVVNEIKKLYDEGNTKIFIIDRMKEKGIEEITYYRLNKILNPKPASNAKLGRPKGSKTKAKRKTKSVNNAIDVQSDEKVSL